MISTAARLLLGLTFTVFSLDGVLHFLPLPPMPEPALAVLEVLRGYGVFYLVKGFELVGGLLLLGGRRPTLAALLLSPVIVNILWFDAALDPASLPVGLLLALLTGRLLWDGRRELRPLLGPTPAAQVP